MKHAAKFQSTITALAGMLFLAHAAAAQFTQQGGKLIGTGAVNPAFQGSPVAISADGNTAIVGGPYDNSDYGAEWVYTRSGGLETCLGPAACPRILPWLPSLLPP